MGSAARRHVAYGGKYLRAGLRLRVRGGRKKTKDLVKLGQKGATYQTTSSTAADQNQGHPSRVPCLLFISVCSMSWRTSFKKTLSPPCTSRRASRKWMRATHVCGASSNPSHESMLAAWRWIRSSEPPWCSIDPYRSMAELSDQPPDRPSSWAR
jgi:hypothetical protein